MGLFHIYTAGVRPLPAVQQRTIHLSFALAITFLMFPFRARKDDAQEEKVSNEYRPFSVDDVSLSGPLLFPGRLRVLGIRGAQFPYRITQSP